MLNETYLFADRPAGTALSPERNIAFITESHGSNIYSRLLLPAVERENQRFPVALFLHGFPGLEQNLDIVYALRRAGIATVHFNYRGVWGGHGNYRFSHLLEDTAVLLQHLTDNADAWQLDTERIYLVGHSMGGFTALNIAASGANIAGAILIAPCDLIYMYEDARPVFDNLMLTQEKGYFTMPYKGYLEEDVAANAAHWRFIRLADQIPQNLPLHFIGGTVDTATPPQEHIIPLYRLLQERGMKVGYTEFDDGHTFPANRIGLTRLIFRKINEMEASR